MSGDDLVNPLILRFTSVVFGVLASLFLLNATINHHIEGYREVDPTFFDKFLSSIYVDDVSFSSPDVSAVSEVHLTRLIVTDAHKRILHSGVKETLTEVRSSFWIVRGRQFVQSIIHECVVCYQSVPPLPLPD